MRLTAIDVLLPVRCPSPYLQETLAGLVSQDFTDWRLVVVIHGKDDGVSASVAQFELAADVHIVPQHLSLAQVLNVGLAHCTAPLVARLDADDVPLPGRLRTQRELLLRNTNCALVVSPAVEINHHGVECGIRKVPSTPKRLIRSLQWKNCIIHPAVMFHRQSVIAVGGYSELAQHAEDYDLWLRLLATHDACVSSSPAIQYRLHSGQVTSQETIEGRARARILETRLKFARARKIPTALAWMQHSIWSVRQAMRDVSRRHQPWAHASH